MESKQASEFYSQESGEKLEVTIMRQRHLTSGNTARRAYTEKLNGFVHEAICLC
jgi:hypothetical protein